MNQLKHLPTYRSEEFPPFLLQLRALLFDTQQEAADHFGLDRTRISRYETGAVTPRIGYMAELARLIAGRAQSSAPTEQFLLEQLNLAIEEQYRMSRFGDWSMICQTADDYLAQQRAKQEKKVAQERTKSAKHPSSSPTTPQTQWESRLEPATYNHLVGFEGYIAQVVEALCRPGPPWIVAIEGLGGVGKTSLAHAVSREISQRETFDDFGWVSVRDRIFNFDGSIQEVTQAVRTVESLLSALIDQLLPELANSTLLAREGKAFEILKARFKELPHLIVIDNLETLADVETLVPKLQAMVEPTKFLLTTRESLYAVPTIHHVSLDQLTKPDALQLVRREAEVRNFQRVLTATPAQLDGLYETVGGNPLALRLVVGQTHTQYPRHDLGCAPSRTGQDS
ncbi:hypothetical protein KFU94_39805 [Chloroflexi bacterium TSY]|nr:hypothetical protein [Chloroflexi bacterium TSY]